MSFSKKKHLKYASNRYHNTQELLHHSYAILDGLELPNVTMLERMNKKKMAEYSQSLEVKLNVLGYLESMTKGGVHRQQISADNLRLYTDWVVSETPKQDFPSTKFGDAIPYFLWLRNHIAESPNKSDAKRDVLRALYLESRPEVKIENVENIVFAGGGAKALSLAGAVRSLENRGVDGQIKRVAGTSGGAILALAFAVGYSSKEIESIVLDNHFGLFTLGSRMDWSVLNQWAHNSYSEKPNSKLHVISDNKLARVYYKHLMEGVGKQLSRSTNPKLVNFRKALQKTTPDNIGKKFVSLIEKLPNKDVFFHALMDEMPIHEQISIDNYARKKSVESIGDEALIGAIVLHKSPKDAMISAMRYSTEQDIVLGFFSDLVFEKINSLPKAALRTALYGDDFTLDESKPVQQADIRNITFKQWQVLHKLCPDDVKELHISISILKPILDRFSGFKYDPYQHEDAAFDNPEFADMRVIDAVRVSMNLPPIYKQYKFTVNGSEYKGSDGGLKSNMSLSTFDSKFPMENTIGIFYKTGSELESAQNVDRMLILPRSKSEVETDLIIVKSIDQGLGGDIGRLKAQVNELESSDPLGNELDAKTAELNETVDQRRRIGFQMTKLEQELSVIKDTEKSPLEILTTSPLRSLKGFAGEFLANYLDSKSNDNLSEVKNLRRLVMVNTKDVDTWHFKMSDENKDLQMKFGEKAMDSLLNGTYCLENHFYYHKFQAVEESIWSERLDVVFGQNFDWPSPSITPVASMILRPDHTEEVSLLFRRNKE